MSYICLNNQFYIQHTFFKESTEEDWSALLGTNHRTGPEFHVRYPAVEGIFQAELDPAIEDSTGNQTEVAHSMGDCRNVERTEPEEEQPLGLLFV